MRYSRAAGTLTSAKPVATLAITAATFAITSAMLAANPGYSAEPLRLTTDGTNKRDVRFIEGGKTLIYCYDETTALIRMMRFSFPDGEPIEPTDATLFLQPGTPRFIRLECIDPPSSSQAHRERSSILDGRSGRPALLVRGCAGSA